MQEAVPGVCRGHLGTFPRGLPPLGPDGRGCGHLAECVNTPGDEFWTERKVAWYPRALARSDSAEKVLGSLLGQRLVPDGAGWVAPYRKQVAVIWWRI